MLVAGVALILNPYAKVKVKKEDQKYIDDTIRKILLNMSDALKNNFVSIKEEELFRLEKEEARKSTYRNLNNYFFVETNYYVEYMEMRVQQFHVLKRMRAHFQRFFMTYEHSIMVSEFTQEVGESLHEENTAKELLDNLQLLRESFKTMELPKDREEFENRAMLFQFLNDLEDFLIIKYDFKKRYIKK